MKTWILQNKLREQLNLFLHHWCCLKHVGQVIICKLLGVPQFHGSACDHVPVNWCISVPIGQVLSILSEMNTYILMEVHVHVHARLVW